MQIELIKNIDVVNISEMGEITLKIQPKIIGGGIVSVEENATIIANEILNILGFPIINLDEDIFEV